MGGAREYSRVGSSQHSCLEGLKSRYSVTPHESSMSAMHLVCLSLPTTFSCALHTAISSESSSYESSSSNHEGTLLDCILWFTSCTPVAGVMHAHNFRVWPYCEELDAGSFCGNPGFLEPVLLVTVTQTCRVLHGRQHCGPFQALPIW